MSHNNMNREETVNLGTLAQMNFSMAPSCVLRAAVQLGFFSLIAAGKTSAAEIASEAKCSERGTRMILNALCSFELLSKKAGRYALHPAVAQHLVRNSSDYMGYLFENDEIWHLWSTLGEIVRTGRPTLQAGPDQQTAQAEKFFSNLVRSLHIMNREPALRLAQAVGAGTEHKGMHVLDVACGSGVWGIAIAEADQDAKVTFQDLPAVLKVTAEFLDHHHMAGKHDFLPGDLNHIEFGDSRFDLAVLGNICHSEGEKDSRRLISHIFRALRPQGRIAIIETMPNEDRTGPVFPLVFALNMLVHTQEGDTFTLSEFTAWLKEAGFGVVTTADIGLNSPAIFATKN
ncbi:MAG: methyltransferase domain-containing protein [Acidobacteriota bacterium]|nr:methyltransferase domain-containing protein [Acidobacteriota bacterium]